MKKSKNSGVWEYNTGVPGMIRHLRYGNYYSRFQINGKRTMKALGTDVFSVAKEKHFRFLADNEKARQSGVVLMKGRGRIGDLLREAVEIHGGNTELKDKTKVCFQTSVDRLLKHWPACFGVDLRFAKPDQITAAQVEKFSNYLHSQASWRRHNTKKENLGYGAVTVNTTLEALHRVFVFAKGRNYISEVPFKLEGELGQEGVRKSEPTKKISFPTQEKIREVFTEIRKITNAPDDRSELLTYLQSRADESGDFVEFMAYSGARVKEAAAWVWEDEKERALTIRGTKSESSKDRFVPKIPAMVNLLRRMKARRITEGRPLKGRAFRISQCREALESACARVGVNRWTHHSLRHLFATTCIEAGVDIPTVSKWLGHSDGGALAMKTYGHLRQEHSLAQAEKVSFGGAT